MFSLRLSVIEFVAVKPIECTADVLPQLIKCTSNVLFECTSIYQISADSSVGDIIKASLRQIPNSAAKTIICLEHLLSYT